MFRDGGVEPMMPLCVFNIYFPPRRRDEHAPMVAVRTSQSCQHRFTGQVLKRRRRVNQPPVEEHPALQSARGNAVSERQLDGTARESRPVHPRKSSALALELILDDSSAGLVHNGVAALGKLRKQC